MMIKLLPEKDGHADIRLMVLAFVVLSGIAAALLFYPPVYTRTAEGRTSGDVTFIDSTGNPLEGILEISGAGITSGPKSNVNFISWSNFPNARIKYDALDIKNISVNFRISGNSMGSKVILENHGVNVPKDVNLPAPGVPVKYVEISSINLSFAEVNISIQYTDSELNDIDENTLAVYGYNNTTGAWSELPASLDPVNNILSTSAGSLSVFAVGTGVHTRTAFPGQINIHDTRKVQVTGDIKSYDEARILIKGVKTSTLTANEIPEKGELEVDARETKNVAVKLKIDKKSSGEIILDDYGKKNPVPAPLPGTPVKFVEIGAKGISYSSAEVTIHYGETELDGADENTLVIYHWGGASWDPLLTSVDTANNTLTATTTLLSPFAVSGGTGGSNKIIVATNRYVILDDPRAGATGTGFSNPGPGYDWTSWNYWSGKNTQINATALYIDNSGTPVSGKIISFTLYWPNNTALTTVNATTNILGLANFSYDLNLKNYYGKWQVKAANGTLNDSTTFIYNWWGCGTGGGCSNSASGHPNNPGAATTVTANSPYLNGKDEVTNRDTAHTTGGSASCTRCHQSYDGSPGGNTLTINHGNNPSDVHRNITCDNANCHGSYTTHGSTPNGELIYSCYNSGCHGNWSNWDRKDLSNKSTLNGPNVNTAISIYSYNNGSSFNATFHTPNSTVPCLICHGPLHNITKPDPTKLGRNTITEDSQCTACHSSYIEHNNSVNCTLCHSDDVHAIKVFAQNATYITGKTNPARGDCTNCHQNSTFLGVLKNLTKAGNYTGRNPPQIPVPLSHSDDTINGTKWNAVPGYWKPGDQLSSCRYCHGNTTHYTSALGRPSQFKGINTVNSTITTGTSWCASCHWQGYVSGGSTYTNTVNTYNFPSELLLVPPEITRNTTYGNFTNASDGTAYVNHSLDSYSDEKCKSCHGALATGATITGFMHSEAIGSGGGPDCISCHDYGKTGASHRINNSAMNLSSSIHADLNRNATNSSWVSAENKKCWGCHDSNGSQPANDSMGSRYSNPYKCYDCHNATSKPYQDVSNAPNVTEHFKGGAEIKAASNASDNSSSCVICHNLTELKVNYTEDDAYNSNYSFASHYGRNRTTDPQIRQGTGTNCSYCHQNASTVFKAAMSDPVHNSNISNHSNYSSNPGCSAVQCHDTGWIHNSTLKRPVLTLPDSTLCLSCHGKNDSGGINYTQAVTGYKEKHNNTVECTECHLNTSKDIHPVKYLQKDASYSTNNSSGVNCISCHQNLTNYPGLLRTPPKIPNPMHHSDNASNGTRWNATGYWEPNNTITSCIYCHNDTRHNATALGRPAEWKGDNIVNSSIANTSNWCASCHEQGYISGGKTYTLTAAVFISANLPVPPEITNGIYAPNLPGYYNHSLTPDYSDSTCKVCHGRSLPGNVKMDEFIHNITSPSCKDCHYSFEYMNGSSVNKPEKFVNQSMYEASPHGSLRCEDCHTRGHNNIAARKSCEDCHAVQQDPKNSTERHDITANPWNYSIPGISGSIVNITDCTLCHDSNLYNNATSSYGLPPKPRNCDYCHTYPDMNYT